MFGYSQCIWYKSHILSLFKIGIIENLEVIDWIKKKNLSFFRLRIQTAKEDAECLIEYVKPLLWELNPSQVTKNLKLWFLLSENFTHNYTKNSLVSHNAVQHQIACHNIVCPSWATYHQCTYNCLMAHSGQLKLFLKNHLLSTAQNHHCAIIKCQYVDFEKN